MLLFLFYLSLSLISCSFMSPSLCLCFEFHETLSRLNSWIFAVHWSYMLNFPLKWLTTLSLHYHLNYLSKISRSWFQHLVLWATFFVLFENRFINERPLSRLRVKSCFQKAFKQNGQRIAWRTSLHMDQTPYHLKNPGSTIDHHTKPTYIIFFSVDR